MKCSKRQGQIKKKDIISYKTAYGLVHEKSYFVLSGYTILKKT